MKAKHEARDYEAARETAREFARGNGVEAEFDAFLKAQDEYLAMLKAGIRRAEMCGGGHDMDTVQSEFAYRVLDYIQESGMLEGR